MTVGEWIDYFRKFDRNKPVYFRMKNDDEFVDEYSVEENVSAAYEDSIIINLEKN